MNPFGLKAALTAKHAQHVVLIHFPIALFISGAAFDFLAHWTKRQNLATAAYFNFSVAAAASLPTMITGLLAWQWQLLEGHAPPSPVVRDCLEVRCSAWSG